MRQVNSVQIERNLSLYSRKKNPTPRLERQILVSKQKVTKSAWNRVT